MKEFRGAARGMMNVLMQDLTQYCSDSELLGPA